MSKRRKIVNGKWSAEEVRLLKKLLPNTPPREIAEKLGRSMSAVRYKRCLIGIRYPHNLWSEGEIKLLKELYPGNGSKVLARKLGRSVDAVRQRAHKTGLKRIGRRPNRRWSEGEIKLVKKLFPGQGPHEIARKLSRSAATVSQKAYEMGLTKQK